MAVTPHSDAGSPDAHPLHDFALTTSKVIGLRLDDDWLPGVLEYLELLFSRADLVSATPLGDEVEPAPVFLP